MGQLSHDRGSILSPALGLLQRKHGRSGDFGRLWCGLACYEQVRSKHASCGGSRGFPCLLVLFQAARRGY